MKEIQIVDRSDMVLKLKRLACFGTGKRKALPGPCSDSCWIHGEDQKL